MKSCSISILIFNLIAIFLSEFGIVEGIVGGQRVLPGTRRYQVSIQANGKHICGGALISDLHVLSAANCFINDDEQFADMVYKVVGGVDSLNDANTVIAIVEKIYVPRGYKRHILDNLLNTIYYSSMDIAVLKFTEKLHFTQMSRMETIKLPNKSNLRPSKYSKLKSIVTGFGIENVQNSDLNTATAEICQNRCLNLKYAESTIILKRSCESLLDNKLHENHLCAKINRGSTGLIGVCYGDVGAPLVINDTIVGVLIKHRGDCNENYLPSMYTATKNLLYFVEMAQQDADINYLRVSQRRITPREGMRELYKFI